jgi:hypothetical protein
MARTKTKKRKTQRAEELAGLQVIFGHGSARSKQDSEQQAAIHFLQQLGGAGAGKKTAKSTLFELAQRGALRPIFITDKVGALFCTTVMMGDGKILLDAKQDQVMRGGDSSALLKIAAEARAMSTKGSIDRDRIVAIMEDEKEKAEIVDFEFFEGSDDLLKAALEAGEGMDAPPAEKRWDDGQLFTFKQFEEYYGEENRRYGMLHHLLTHHLQQRRSRQPQLKGRKVTPLPKGRKVTPLPRGRAKFGQRKILPKFLTNRILQRKCKQCVRRFLLLSSGKKF